MSAGAGSFNLQEMMRRVVVGLKRRDQRDTVALAKFTDCIVNYFAPNEIFTKVSCRLQDKMLVLSPPNQTEDVPLNGMEGQYINGSDLGSVVLQHSPECPIWRLPELTSLDPIPERTLNGGVHVGVAIVIESSDGRILLTQRPDHMRAFPRAWVPPGGHLEYGETVSEGGLRELEEETGLKFDADTCNMQVLCLWESVYPVFLGFGSPRNHHVVIYLYTKATESWKNLLLKMKLDPGEVQACTWLAQDDIKSLFASGEERVKVTNKYIVESNGLLTKPAELNLAQMFPSSLWQQSSIFSGTQLALRRWLDYSNKSTDNIPSKI